MYHAGFVFSVSLRRFEWSGSGPGLVLGSVLAHSGHASSARPSAPSPFGRQRVDAVRTEGENLQVRIINQPASSHSSLSDPSVTVQRFHVRVP
eukprot:scaffold69815_cov64-Phaeocystis_antarctica.AAC.1